MVKLQGFLRVAAACFVGVCAKKLSNDQFNDQEADQFNDQEADQFYDRKLEADQLNGYSSEVSPVPSPEADASGDGIEEADASGNGIEEQPTRPSPVIESEEQPASEDQSLEVTQTDTPKKAYYQSGVLAEKEQADSKSNRYLVPQGQGKHYCEKRGVFAIRSAKTWFRDSWCDFAQSFVWGLYNLAHSDCEQRDTFRGMLAGVKHVFEHEKLGSITKSGTRQDFLEAVKDMSTNPPCGQNMTPMKGGFINILVSEEDDCSCTGEEWCKEMKARMRTFTESNVVETQVPRGKFYASWLYAKGGRPAVMALLNALLRRYNGYKIFVSEVEATDDLIEAWQQAAKEDMEEWQKAAKYSTEHFKEDYYPRKKEVYEEEY